MTNVEKKYIGVIKWINKTGVYGFIDIVSSSYSPPIRWRAVLAKIHSKHFNKLANDELTLKFSLKNYVVEDISFKEYLIEDRSKKIDESKKGDSYRVETSLKEYLISDVNEEDNIEDYIFIHKDSAPNHSLKKGQKLEFSIEGEEVPKAVDVKFLVKE